MFPQTTSYNSELTTWPLNTDGWHTSSTHGTLEEIMGWVLERGNMNLAIQQQLHDAIKKVWKKNIVDDHEAEFLLREDSLKNSLYHHLRIELGDSFFMDNSLRMYTEFRLNKIDNTMSQVADIAIVSLIDEKEMPDEYHIDDRIDDVITIIELKYLTEIKGAFYEDMRKMQEYGKISKLKNTKFYVGFICEESYSFDEGSWDYSNKLSARSIELTQLTAHYNEHDVFIADIIE